MIDTTIKDNRFELDLLCKELSKLLDNGEACDRYVNRSHVLNKLTVTDYNGKDIRGIDRYIK